MSIVGNNTYGNSLRGDILNTDTFKNLGNSETYGGTPKAKKTLNAARKEQIGTVAGAASEVGASIIQGVAQTKQGERARTEARKLADVQRSDDLAAYDINNQIRRRKQDQEEQQFKTQKYIDNVNMRHQTFLSEFKKQYENRNILTNAANILKEKVSQNQDIGNAMAGLWGI